MGVTGILVQARMGSSRLPGKILMDLAGRPMLGQMLDRLRRTKGVDVVVVATSDLPGDDAVARWCHAEGVECFRGSETDVLGRYLAAARQYGMDWVVRACGDAPLTDPGGIEALLAARGEDGVRFIHARHPQGWPVGTACDLFSLDALEEAAAMATQPHEREHVIPAMMANPDRFGERRVMGPPEWLHPVWHLAVDHMADLEWMRRLYAAIGAADPAGFGIGEAMAWIAASGDRPPVFEWPPEFIRPAR